MAQEDSQLSIRKELDAKEEQIKRRLEALEGEIASTPAAIKSAVVNHPLIGLAGAILIGTTVGLLFGARKKKRRRAHVTSAHQALIDAYISAVAGEVSKSVRRGRDPEDAVRRSLRGRAPVIVYAPGAPASEPQDSKGILRQAGDLTLKTAVGFAVKAAIDLLTASVDVKKLQKALLLEEEESRAGAEAHQPHAGDGFPDASTVQNESSDH